MVKDNIELSKSKEIIKKFNIEEKLHDIYNDIEPGQCRGCGGCCCESVATFYTEFLHIMQYLQNHPELMKQLRPKMEYYYNNETIKKMDCPFLDDNKRCIIYDVRPHNCRIFGLLTKSHYEESYKQVLKNNIKIANKLKKQGIEVSQEVIYHKLPYCTNFIPNGGKRLAKNKYNDIIDRLIGLDAFFFMEGIIDPESLGTGIVTWFAKTLGFEGK